VLRRLDFVAQLSSACTKVSSVGGYLADQLTRFEADICDAIDGDKFYLPLLYTRHFGLAGRIEEEYYGLILGYPTAVTDTYERVGYLNPSLKCSHPTPNEETLAITIV
jgi:hypothetical protein